MRMKSWSSLLPILPGTRLGIEGGFEVEQDDAGTAGSWICCNMRDHAGEKDPERVCEILRISVAFPLNSVLLPPPRKKGRLVIALV